MAISRFLIGGVASALLLTGGLFMWKGYTQIAEEEALPDPPPALPAIPVAAAGAPKRGPAPPALPAAKEASREERRFNRFDRDRNDRISRVELMSSRTAAFRKLDKDGNNLLTFEEWAAATGQAFCRGRRRQVGRPDARGVCDDGAEGRGKAEVQLLNRSILPRRAAMGRWQRSSADGGAMELPLRPLHHSLRERSPAIRN